MSTVCSSCGEKIAAKAKKCKHCGADLRNWFVRHYIITTLLVLMAIGAISSAGDTGSSFQEPVATREYADISCADFSQKFGLNSDLTNLQREELFKSTYRNKYVKWSGEVVHIDQMLGQLSVQVKCLSTTFVSDAIITFASSEKDKLLALREGQQISFEAQMNDWGELIGTQLRRGRLVE